LGKEKFLHYQNHLQGREKTFETLENPRKWFCKLSWHLAEVFLWKILVDEISCAPFKKLLCFNSMMEEGRKEMIRFFFKHCTARSERCPRA
jgi:hypothetical protein